MTETDIKRRKLLTVGAAVAATTGLGPFSEALASTPKVPRRRLGKTGKDIPILLLGGGGGWDPKFDPKIAEGLRYGVDYLDLARMYAGGTSEQAAATTLKRLNALNKVWITSKSKAHDPAGLEKSVDETISVMGRNPDLYFLHAVEDPAPLKNSELFKRVEQLKKQGKIKFFGFSCHEGNVAELLQLAAKIPSIDAVMFRYNFRQYGNKELNNAIDAAHKANVGLIAMKTQGSEAGIADAWKRYEKTGKWTKHQAVLKAVWEDKRISAAVSHMDNMTKLRQNIAAALDKQTLGALDREALQRYARATRAYACDGCDHLCGQAVGAEVKIGTVMRCVMYHDVYGQPDKARSVFNAQPEAAKQLAQVDFRPANAACPHGVDVQAHMRRAEELFG